MKNRAKPLIAVTLGDITGTGPEIVVKVIGQNPPDDCRILVVGDGQVLRSSFSALGISFNLPVFRTIEEAVKSEAPVTVLDLAQGGTELLALGRPHPEAGQMAAESLTRAARMAVDGWVDGVVYAPLVKETMHIGERKYNDEGEMLRELLEAPGMKAVAKCGEVFRVTIVEHVPMKKMPDLITRQSVLDAIEVLQEALLFYGLGSPRIAVAALNPHAGEGGLVGREEIDQIAPAIQEARSKGIGVAGPIPADTVYVRAFKGQYDGVVGMYHDQANIAFKVAGFGEIVVLFVRSPIVIATPSHGPAYGRAGKGTADPNNLRVAMEVAAFLARRKKAVAP